MSILILKLPHIIENIKINSKNYLRFHQPKVTIINILVAILIMEFFMYTHRSLDRINHLYIYCLSWKWLPLIF